jgi:GT2 family glycosyltransferase
MLSFLRTRSTRSSPPRPPSCDLEWSGRELTLRLDRAPGIERVALDLDGSFFAEIALDTNRIARCEFSFAPDTRAEISVLPRDGRDGAPLVDAPLAFRFGEPGTSARRGVDVPIELGDIGSHVPFGVDCAANEVAIVVPVYGAPVLVERCLDSVLAQTTGRARLIVIDDASPDAAIAPLLARYASRANVCVLRNERNRGFTATANRGIAEAGSADVVLLNADAEVGPNWLTGLRRAAASAPDVATVTAVSDNAGAFSVPELERENTMPARWRFEDAARALWQQAGHAYPALPTGNGFCMFIRRAVIDAVGLLDEAAFPEGYGEENDFCQRASARGMRHLIAGNVYVHHERSASFGHERRARLGAAGMAVMRERRPNYEADVAATLHSFERRVLDWRVRRIFATADAAMPGFRSLVVGDADAKPLPRAERLWDWLQARAIEAIVVAGECPGELPRFAAMLGIPLANAGSGESVAACGANAIVAARSFPEALR